MKGSTGLLFYLLISSAVFAQTNVIFSEQRFSDQDAVLVSDHAGRVIYAWQSDQLFIPASLTKILTSYLAIDKWSLSHRFITDFYLIGSQLWVKGYGDPYLIAEEIDQIVTQLSKFNLEQINSIHIDASYFSDQPVPGRSSVADPYNAPLSAVAANFNTVFVQKKGTQLVSAEIQTPLTATAKKLAALNQGLLKSGQKARVNLVNSNNAQMNFAEILAIKLGRPSASVHINQSLPKIGSPNYRHLNSHSLESVLTGAMKYSNNFIANQTFLKLAEQANTSSVSFASAQAYLEQILTDKFDWPEAAILEGAGLSRSNKLSAQQIDQLLVHLDPYKHIFKEIIKLDGAKVFAKTGTLNGISNYAGYIDFPQQQYRFVFMFNRSTSYGYRDRMLQQLVEELSVMEIQ
ncbi:D-alanyl-D-alanine carboxypeptidase [Arenicella sp.]|nr:D-alanyl-D-alanine carboxypeptidase [Arenicella sp.]